MSLNKDIIMTTYFYGKLLQLHVSTCTIKSTHQVSSCDSLIRFSKYCMWTAGIPLVGGAVVAMETSVGGFKEE